MARPTPEQIRAAGEKAAQYLRAGLEAGRLAFRQGRPRESLANDAERIGYDEAAYDAAHAGVKVGLPAWGQWTRTKDAKPPVMVDVLAYYQGGGWGRRHFNGIAWFSDYGITEDPIAWMPAPPDPAGVAACRWPDCGCHAAQGPGECRARAAGVQVVPAAGSKLVPDALLSEWLDALRLAHRWGKNGGMTTTENEFVNAAKEKLRRALTDGAGGTDGTQLKGGA